MLGDNTLWDVMEKLVSWEMFMDMETAKRNEINSFCSCEYLPPGAKAWWGYPVTLFDFNGRNLAIYAEVLFPPKYFYVSLGFLPVDHLPSMPCRIKTFLVCKHDASPKLFVVLGEMGPGERQAILDVLLREEAAVRRHPCADAMPPQKPGKGWE